MTNTMLRTGAYTEFSPGCGNILEVGGGGAEFPGGDQVN